MRALFFGPPGSGKGTQASRLCGKRGLAHVSSGELLRAAVRGGSALGVEAKGFMDRGALVPDRLVLGLLFERLSAADCASGFVLDGFPRTRAQAEAVEGSIGRPGRHALDLALLFRLSDDAVVERMAGRRTCTKCGAAYHVSFRPPSRDGACDRCGGALHRRADDEPAIVRERLAVHRRDESSLADLYRRQGVLRELDAAGSVDEVGRGVERAAEG